MGYRLWPGILVGAFLVHVTSADGATVPGTVASLGIAAGSTLQSLLGAWLVNRFGGGPRAFDRAQDV